MQGNLSVLRIALVAGALAVAASTTLSAQSGPPSTVRDAVSLIQAHEFARAATILDSITKRDSDNGRAWVLLGSALQSAGDLDAALVAHRRAAEFDAQAPTALYNAGMAYALKNQPDDAFEWLRRSKATGRIDMTRLGLDSNSESLRRDPRYAALFPTESEYADPFEEPVEIVHEWRGEVQGNAFGWIARNIGDVDGDGANDVTTSAPNWGSDGSLAGKVYVYSGRGGELLWTQEGEPGAQLGLGIEAAGDVNADGVPDVIAGAPPANKAYVYSGSDGSVLLTLEGEQDGDAFGGKVSDVGDLNGDGHDDVLIGAPNADQVGDNSGRTYVVSGRDGAFLLVLEGEEAGDLFGSSAGGIVEGSHVFLVVGAPGAGPENHGRTYVYDDLSGEPAFVIEADETGTALGAMFVSVVGDVNGDRVPDIYASDWSNSANGRSTGRIYVHSGADGERLLTLTGEAPGDGFGIGPADAGDVDGDGYDDLIIGAWQHAGSAPSGGKVYLYSGRDGSLQRTLTGKVMGETFGFDATGMGDVNGDGVIDFLLTSAWSAVNGARSGRMFIVSGAER